MALKHILIFGSVLASILATKTAGAQVNIPSPRFQYKDVEKPESTRPYITPGVFDYDTQVFAPIEFDGDEQLKPNIGFYATFDKTYTSITRAGNLSENSNSPLSSAKGSDYIWGTRYELGWMDESNDGWGLAFQRGDGTYYAFGGDIASPNSLYVNTDVAQFEINKLFRQTLKQGGYFEPYVGARYISLSDNTSEDNIITVPLFTTSNRFVQNTTNSAFGLQAGARYNKNHGRWRSTFDGAIATSYNQQRYFASNVQTLVTPLTTTVNVDESYRSDQSFLPLIDFQYELAYHISRDIALRGGVQASWLWNGIARANTQTMNLNPNSLTSIVGSRGAGIIDTDFVAAGFIFGFEWRR